MKCFCAVPCTSYIWTLDVTSPFQCVRRLAERFEQLLAQALEGKGHGSRLRIAVVGGGAGGVELTLALAHRLRTELNAQGRPAAERPAITWGASLLCCVPPAPLASLFLTGGHSAGHRPHAMCGPR